jgi:muramoyltetrapeptide carboxypeptidase
LVGGNLTLLANTIGTRSEVDTKNNILFIEDIGEYLYSIDRLLYQLKRSGKLKTLKGLLIGGFTDMKDTERPFGKTIYQLIAEAIGEVSYPVCFNFPVSHGKENLALKIGVEYELNVTSQKTTLKEI